MLRTPLCELLGIEHPIIAAPIGPDLTGPELVAAVSNAGGLGILQAQLAPPALFRRKLQRVRELTDKPFGVNLILHVEHQIRPGRLGNEAREIIAAIGAFKQARLAGLSEIRSTPSNPRLQLRRMAETVESSRAPEPVGAFPHAKRVGNLLFLSGIGPRKRGSKEIPGVKLDPVGNVVSYDIETQCRAVFENVRLVLEDAGANWNDIVDITVFLTNMKKDFPIYNKLYAQYFSGEGKPNPTRTTIEVGALPTPIAIELKVIAAIA